MKKALQVASVASMIDQFTMPNIDILKELGYEVDVVANFDFGSTSSKERVEEFQKELNALNVNVFNLLFNRKIFDVCNIQVYKQLKQLIDLNSYEIIHCHSPIGGVITRLAARKARKKGTKVIYTAHGFHFYKGSLLLNWLIYYPVEWICSWLTDVLITINKEDYSLAQRSMKAKEVCYVPGVGINTEILRNVDFDRIKKREELGIPIDATMLLSVGELNKNKNHEVIINALHSIDSTNIYYCITGKGELEGYLRKLVISLGLEERVRFLGFRKDVKDIYKVSDIFCFPSYREGLSVALMEAMATGLPVVCSDIRGNKDLIDTNKSGYLCAPNNVQGYIQAINNLVENKDLRRKKGEYNSIRIMKFDIKEVKRQMKKIYMEDLHG